MRPLSTTVQRVLPVQRPLPLFDAVASRRIEAGALAAAPPHALMRRAGESVARLALALAPHARRVWVAAGPGNNGGDGLEAAIHLLRAGKEVAVRLHRSPHGLPADADDALARAQAAGVVVSDSSSGSDDDGAALEAGDIAIDALLGLGASRAPDGPLADSIRRLTGLGCAVLAVDLPSGLDADTGQPLGGTCVNATDTLALLTLKPGLFTGAGRDHAGRIWLDALGVDTAPLTPDAWLVGHRPDASARRHAQHKGSFGDVAVVGGAHGMTGAALLAAGAAHAAGAGRVFVDLLEGAAAASTTLMGHDTLRPELMFRPGWWRGEPASLAATTVVCGCGGGTAVGAALPRLLHRAARLVLDADALNAVAGDPGLQRALRARAATSRSAASSGGATVLTPHPLEAARLLDCPTPQVQADRWQAARDLAERFGCVVVLKGSGTIVAAPGQTPRVNATGNAALAGAGTGDVLAGWLAGSWAQAGAAGRTEAGDTATALAVAARAVAAHGAAAEPARPGALRAADLIETLHRRLRDGV